MTSIYNHLYIFSLNLMWLQRVNSEATSINFHLSQCCTFIYHPHKYDFSWKGDIPNSAGISLEKASCFCWILCPSTKKNSFMTQERHSNVPDLCWSQTLLGVLVVLMGNTSNFFEKKSRIWYLCIFVRDLKICKMFVIFSIKMFCVPANLALKKLCYVLKCLLDTDAFLLSNNDHLDINLSSKHQKIKLLVSLLFCFLSLRLPQSSIFLNFWTTSQHYTPTFFFLDGGTRFDNQISYLRKNSKFWSFGTIFPDRVIQNINFRTTTPSRNTDYLTLLTWYGTLGLVKETQ